MTVPDMACKAALAVFFSVELLCMTCMLRPELVVESCAAAETLKPEHLPHYDSHVTSPSMQV